MNLGIIAASIAPVRPLFVNLERTAQVPSETVRGPYASNRPFLNHLNASGAAAKPAAIVLGQVGITETLNVDTFRNRHELAEEGAESEGV